MRAYRWLVIGIDGKLKDAFFLSPEIDSNSVEQVDAQKETEETEQQSGRSS